jgi:hypothetical protein
MSAHRSIAMAYDLRAASASVFFPAHAAEPLPVPTDWSAALLNGIVLTQQLQLEAALSWQRWAASLGQEWWDLWCCHYAGGVPIDA